MGLPQGCPSASSTTKALAPTDRPPPGFQNPFTQTSLAPLSTLQGNKPPGLSLGSLASEHLKTQPSSGLENLVPGTLGSPSLPQNTGEEGKKETAGKLSLGSLASQHLESEAPVPNLARLTLGQNPILGPQNGPNLGALADGHLSGSNNHGVAPTLGSLAASHLSTTSSKAPLLGLGSLALNQPQIGENTSLGNLASSHLQKTDSGSTLGSLADIHLSNIAPSVGRDHAKSSGTAQAVDLTSALRLSTPQVSAAPVPPLPKRVQVHESDGADVSLLVIDIPIAPRALQKRRASSFGLVISRKWRRLEDFSPLKITLPRYQHLPQFAFDTPSPDDVVKSAQSQSRAFRPAASAS